MFGIYEDDPCLGNFSVFFINFHLSSSHWLWFEISWAYGV